MIPQQTTETSNSNLIWLDGIEKIGVPIIELKCGGEMLKFVLDTGASDNVIEMSVCRRLNAVVMSKDAFRPMVDFDGRNLEKEASAIIPITICDSEVSTQFTVIDDKRAFFEVLKNSGVQVQGLLGVPFIIKANLLIDLKNRVAVYAGERPQQRKPESIEKELFLGDEFDAFEFDELYC